MTRRPLVLTWIERSLFAAGAVLAAWCAVTIIEARYFDSLAVPDAGIRSALCYPGPVLVRVATDYKKRPIRWIKAVKKKYTDGLTFDQKARFLARVGSRMLASEAND